MQEDKESQCPIDRVVMRDIKKNMLKITAENPINNSGSYPMTLLWQIYEESEEYFEEHGLLEMYSDERIAGLFKVMFPDFIARYPSVMKLDT